jgi:hypothetical protein
MDVTNPVALVIGVPLYSNWSEALTVKGKFPVLAAFLQLIVSKLAILIVPALAILAAPDLKYLEIKP